MAVWNMDLYCSLHVFKLCGALTACFVSVCTGAIDVSVPSKTAVEDTSVALSCQYSIVSPAVFFGLLWVKENAGGADNIAYFQDGDADVTYYPNYTSGYVMSTDIISTRSTLTILSVSKQADNGTYRCDLYVNEPGFKTYEGRGELTVISDPCDSGPCANGGTCLTNGTNFNCQCSQDYQGDVCDKEIDPCDPNPCENGGTCTADKGQTNCTCLKGYTGSTCTDEEPPSSTDPPKGLSVEAKVGIAIGCVVPVVVMIGILTYCCCKKQEKQKRKDDMTMRKPEEGEEKSHLEKDDRDAS